MTSSNPEKNKNNSEKPKQARFDIDLDLIEQNNRFDDNRGLRYESHTDDIGSVIEVLPPEDSVEAGEQVYPIATMYIDKAGRIQGEAESQYGIFVVRGDDGNELRLRREDVKLKPNDKILVASPEVATMLDIELAERQKAMSGGAKRQDFEDISKIAMADKLPGNLSGDVIELSFHKAISDKASKTAAERRKDEKSQSKKPDTAPTEVIEPQAEAQEELSEAEKALNASRTSLATLAAKRQGHLFDRGGEKYNEIKDEYTTDLRSRGKELIDKVRSELDTENMTDEEIAAKLDQAVVAFLAEEQEKLRTESVDKLNGTKVGWFVDKITSGSRKVQFAKAVGIGFVGVGLGIAAGAAVGATLGAGAAAGAVIGVRGIVRTATGYAQSDAKRGRGLKTELSERDKKELNQKINDDENDDRLESGVQHIDSIFEDDIHEQQIERRKSVARGLGGAALGALLGGATVKAVEFLIDAHASGADTVNLKENHDSWDDWAPADRDLSPNNTITDPADLRAAEGGNDGLLSAPELNSNADTNSGVNTADLVSTIEAEPDSNTPEVSLAGEYAVEEGNGYTHEIMDAFAQNGADISAEEAYAVHQNIVDNVGADYIDIAGHDGADVYSMGASPYETGIATPGVAEWDADAANILENAIENELSSNAATPEVGGVDVVPTPESADPTPSAPAEADVADSGEQLSSAPDGYRDLTNQEIADKLRQQTTDIRLSAEQVETALNSDLLTDRLVAEGLAERTNDGLVLKVDDNGNLSRDLVRFFENNADQIDPAQRLNGLLG